MHNTHKTAIDLFSGCGGLTEGLKQAGFNVISAVEIEPLAAETYSQNHPEVNLLNSDIRTIGATDLIPIKEKTVSPIDLLAGCPPCQGFSRMKLNNKSGYLRDPRNRLIDEVLRLVREIYPKVIMLENVPNLKKYSRYLTFKRELKKLGYFVTDQVIDVSNFGVPQRRKRLVFLASRLGIIDLPSAPLRRSTVREAFTIIPGETNCADPLHDTHQKRSERIMRLIQAIPKDGGSRTALSEDLRLKCHERNDGYYDVYGRMKWDDVSPTITGGCINPSKGRFLHPEEDRAITLREAALLQSFPISYKFSLRKGKYAAAEMIGNAFPPKFSSIQGKEIARHIAYHEG
ncbi:DNA (cytosine-5-)-methyltransferase [Alcanivorax sp. PA15-N-34]|uniref:Cytosine-specific methyltransferase n=1 Tax=Alcanivorax sediminis TaxID=2663008 RepID=A0A6N7LP17_9GAMM|nr:DNA (cytosine-5-)-methyltransferase [Alcanivorax sediminis]